MSVTQTDRAEPAVQKPPAAKPAWLSLVVGEQVNGDGGLGFMMMEAREFSQTDVVVLGLVVYAALGLLSDLAIRAAERRLLSWRRGLRAT